MGKIRVHKLAAELGLSNKDMTQELKNLGYPVKNQMSTVDMDEVLKIREFILAKNKEEDQKKAAEKEELEKEEADKKTKEEAAKAASLPDETAKSGVGVGDGSDEETLEVIEISENLSLKQLAEKMESPPNEFIKLLIKEGVMVTINQAIDEKTVEAAGKIFNKNIRFIPIEADEIIDELEDEDDNPDDQTPRPPVVTIMGHVDHGKTTLLDAIRESKVTENEAGGITQHIGAYRVEHKKGLVVFLDTPGHEAFTAMRARGAQVTDIVVLVVAADDGLMPQTIEAIHHARAGNVPIIVAVNKIDKPNCNIEKVKKDLSEHELVPEEWGGQTIFAEVSALQKIGLDHLMEMILLQAEVLELKGNTKVRARGTIIESRLDKGRGAVATVHVQKGVLKNGNSFIAGSTYGKIRAMLNDKGKKTKEAEISSPVEIVGLSSVPVAGES